MTEQGEAINAKYGLRDRHAHARANGERVALATPCPRAGSA